MQLHLFLIRLSHSSTLVQIETTVKAELQVEMAISLSIRVRNPMEVIIKEPVAQTQVLQAAITKSKQTKEWARAVTSLNKLDSHSKI